MSRSRNVLAQFLAFGLLLDVSTAIAFAQSAPPGQGSKPTQATPAETLHTSTQLVIVDVVVQDRDGRAIHGLKPENFVLTEQKKPQKIRNFEEHTSSNQKPGPAIPPMPPGTFTDYTPVPPGSTLNVLLIDSLNTPTTDQMYVRRQLLDYIKHEKPGARVAIFGLANHLFMLQGFTSDPAVLQSAAQNLLHARASSLLNDPTGAGSGMESLSDAIQDAMPSGSGASTAAESIASIQQFEAEQNALQTRLRVLNTLDAFNTLAHYLSNFSGRKNLIWFSGSFPLEINPDPTAGIAAFRNVDDWNSEYRETENLLSTSQTAVYPVDARGLMINPALQASNARTNYKWSNPSAFNNVLTGFTLSQAEEHATMERLASDTGGRAFYNTNDLADAVGKALDEGSNYYTVTYTPTDHNWNGAYRNIRIELAGYPAAFGYKLSYRRGYNADDPQKLPKGSAPPMKTATADAATPAVPVDHAAEAYSRAAISRGAPMPSDILFKVRILPLTGKDEDAVAPDNRADPNGRMKRPYRTFAVDYVALPGEFVTMPQSDGRRTGAIEFTTLVYDPDGNLLNMSDKRVSMNLSADTYKRFISTPVRFQLQVSAPVKQQSFMRVIIRDVPSNHYGVVEISTAQVGRLPPLEAQAAPADAKPAAAATPAQPGTKQ